MYFYLIFNNPSKRKNQCSFIYFFKEESKFFNYFMCVFYVY